MAILDNFEVTVLTLDLSSSCQKRRSTDPRWVEIEEYNPPGSDTQRPAFNTCRRYLGVPPLQNLDSTDRVSTEFVIDYKVRCGFTFPDQCDTGAEYIVFRTYLDDEKIGAASVNRSRWERSGTYRQRKQGRRYKVEYEDRWIRQRWMFDPGLHGTIKVEVWRERTKIPVMQSDEWGLIDLTGDNDLVVRQWELPEMAHEFSVKRPRVKNMVKVDLVPLATFEFEYRSSNTLRILGVADLAVDEKIETGVPASNQQAASMPIIMKDDSGLWRTATSASSSGDTFGISMDMVSNTVVPSYEHRRYSCGDAPGAIPRQLPTEYTDAIGRSLVTGLSPAVMSTSYTTTATKLMGGSQNDDAIPILEEDWWERCNEPLKTESTQHLIKSEFVDLTMLD